MKSVHGCYDCAREYIKTNQTFTTDDFIRIATARHKGKYDYSESNYTTAKGKVKIFCKEHGYFEQDAFNHMKGSGCRPCVNNVMFNQRKADKAHFIKRAEKRHGDRYDYSKVEYVNAKTRVTIICKEHGEFTAIPDNHWTSGGICPDCDDYKSGYDRNKFGIFYVISADNLVKVGITNNQPHSRLKSVSESSGLVFNTVKHFEHKDGSLINELENIMLKKLRSSYQQPTYKFDGYTESFFDVDVQSLLLDIEVEFNILKESYGKIKTEERET